MPLAGHAARTRPSEAPAADVLSFLNSINSSPRLLDHDEILYRITTPYDPSAFERLLQKHNLTSSYPLLVRNLRNGFPMGDFPTLHSTVIFPNDKSADDHAAFIDMYLQEEVAGRGA